jgi:SagB-type dehydrogenase family enzyme
MKTRRGMLRAAICATAAGLVMLPGTITTRATPESPPEDVALPPPVTTGGMSLNEALSRRRSQREFTGRGMTPEQLSQLCWAAQGITEPVKGLRTAPSALALYSVAVYVVNAQGIFEYLPKTHVLRRLRGAEAMPELRAAMNAPSASTAPVCMVLAMDTGPLETRAGRQAERYCLLEAGHIAQNILLEATALGLASVPVGGMDESKVAAALKLPANRRPVYVLPIGYARAKE